MELLGRTVTELQVAVKELESTVTYLRKPATRVENAAKRLARTAAWLRRTVTLEESEATLQAAGVVRLQTAIGNKRLQLYFTRA